MSESDGNDSVRIASSGSDTCVPLKKKYFGQKYTQILSRQRLLEKTNKRCGQLGNNIENVNFKENEKCLSLQNGDDSSHTFVQNGTRILNEHKQQRNSAFGINSSMAKNVRKNSWLNSAKQDGSSFKLGNITVRSVVSQPQMNKKEPIENEPKTEYSDSDVTQEEDSVEEVSGVGSKRKYESYSSDSATSIIYMDDLSEEKSRKPARKKKKKTNTPKKQSVSSDFMEKNGTACDVNKHKDITKRKIFLDFGEIGKDEKVCKRTPTKKQRLDRANVIPETSSSDSEVNQNSTQGYPNVKSRAKKYGSKQRKASSRLSDLGKSNGENIFSQVINASRGNSSESSDATILENSSDAPILGSSYDGSFSSKQSLKNFPSVKIPSIHLEFSDEEEKSKTGSFTSKPVSKSFFKNQSVTHDKDGLINSASPEEDEDSQPLLEPIVPVNPHLSQEDLPSASPCRHKNNKLSLNKSKRNNTVVDLTPKKERLQTNHHQNSDNSSQGKAIQKEKKVVFSDSSSDTDIDLPLETIIKKKRTSLDNSSINMQTKSIAPVSRGVFNVNKSALENTGTLQVEPSVDEDTTADVTTLTILKPKTLNCTSSSSTEMSEIIPYQAPATSKRKPGDNDSLPQSTGTTANFSTKHCDSARDPDKGSVNPGKGSVNTETDSEVRREIKQEVEAVNVKLSKQWSGVQYTQEDDTILIDSDSDDEDLLENFSQQTVGLSLGNEVESSQDLDHSQELQELLDLSDTEIDDDVYTKKIKPEPSPEKTSGNEDGDVDEYDDIEMFSSDESLYSLGEDERYGYDVATQVSPDFVRANGGDEFFLDSPTLDCQDPLSNNKEFENYSFDTAAQTSNIDPYYSATQVQKSVDDPYNTATQVDETSLASRFSADTQMDNEIKPEYMAATQRDVVSVTGVKSHGRQSEVTIDLTEEDTGSSSELDDTDSNAISIREKTSEAKHKEEVSNKESTSYKCPVCDKDIPCKDLIEMEGHIDICLNVNMIKEFEETDKMPEFDSKDKKIPTPWVQETERKDSDISSVEDTDNMYEAQTQVIPSSREDADKSDNEDPYMAQTQLDDMYRDLSDDTDDNDNDDKYIAATQVDTMSHDSVHNKCQGKRDSIDDGEIDLYTSMTQVDGGRVMSPEQLEEYVTETVDDTGPGTTEDNDLYTAMTQVDGGRVMSPEQLDEYVTETVDDTGPGTTEDDDLYSAQTQVDAAVMRDSSDDDTEDMMDTEMEHTQDKPNSTKRDPGKMLNRTSNRPEISGQSPRLIRIKQLSVTSRKPILVSPQKLKSLSEKREEFKQLKEKTASLEKEKASAFEKTASLEKSKFYSSRNFFEKFSSGAGPSGSNIDEKKKQNYGGWMSKSETIHKRKRHKSKEVVDTSASLERAMLNAKCQLNDRKFHTALHPEPVIRKSISSGSSSSQSEDVRPPNDEEIRKLGLPVLEYQTKEQKEDDTSVLIQETTSCAANDVQPESVKLLSTNSEVLTSHKNKEVTQRKLSVKSSVKDDGRKTDSDSKKTFRYRKESSSDTARSDAGDEKPKDKSERKRSTDSKVSSSSNKKDKIPTGTENKDSKRTELEKVDSKGKERRISEGEKHRENNDRDKDKRNTKHHQEHRTEKSVERKESKENDKDSEKHKSKKKDYKHSSHHSSSHRHSSNHRRHKDHKSSRHRYTSGDSKKENIASSSDHCKEKSKDLSGQKAEDTEKEQMRNIGSVNSLLNIASKESDSSQSVSRHKETEINRNHNSSADTSDQTLSCDSSLVTTALSAVKVSNCGQVINAVDVEIFSSKLQNAKVDKFVSSQECGKDVHCDGVEAVEIEPPREISESEQKRNYDNKFVIKKKSSLKGILKDPTKPSSKEKRRVSFKSPDIPNAQERTQRYIKNLTENGPPQPQRKSSINIPSSVPETGTAGKIHTGVLAPSGNAVGWQPVPISDRPNLMEKLPIGNIGVPVQARLQQIQQKRSHAQNNSSKGTAYINAQPSTSRTSDGKLMPPQAFHLDSSSLDYYLSRLLKWNVKWFEEQAEVKELPPIMDGPCTLYHIPGVFKSFKDYIEIFTPHLMAETWEIAMKAHSGNKSKPKSKIKVLFTERVKSSEKLRQLKFYGILTKKETDNLRSTDVMFDGGLVIMHMWGQHQQNSTVPLRPELKKPTYSLQLCMMERVCYYTRDAEKKETLETFPIFYEEEAVKSKDFVVVLFIMKGRASYFQPLQDKFCYIEPIVSLVSTMRQLTAMNSLAHSPLCAHILNPQDTAVFRTTWGPHENSNVPFISKYNNSQRLAIEMAGRLSVIPSSVPKIMLLQGPPGSGKSHTIIGMVDRIIKETHRQGCVCVCAPSNAAIDVIVKKLMEYKKTMLRKSGDAMYNLGIVRIGNQSTMLPEVKPIGLNELVQTNIREDAMKQHMQNIPASVRDDLTIKKQRIKVLNDQLSVLEAEKKHMQARKVTSDIKKEKKLLEDMERQYIPQLSKATYAQEYDMKKKVLLNADIICGTLNSFGNESIRDIIVNGIQGNKFRFSCTIIDEACQANELDCLIPLVYGITKLILVGDPEQLPPTVLSQKAEDKKFGQSLFERFYDHFKLTSQDQKSNPTLMLDTQYRMDEEIASFPSRYIYDEKLKTDSCVALRESPLKPYLLYNVEDSQENQSQVSGSISNVTEAEFIVELTAYILENKWVAPHDIGIIAPYKNQKYLLANELRKHKVRAMCNVEVGTVDGFQGREKRVVILSCVRAKSDSGSIGFMANRRRMNVALTRAKIALYIVGHLDSLKDANREWRELINDAESRKLIVNVEAQRHFKRAIQMCCSPSKKPR